MRATRTLKSRAAAQKQAVRMTELDRVITHHLQPNRPDTFYTTSGDSSTERAPERWMPHDHQPIIGFSPRP